MSSGDLYTEFKKAFVHFRRNWLLYVIISIPVLLVPMYYQTFEKDQVLEYLLFTVIDYSSLLFITGLLTSVTAKKHLRTAVKESTLLLRKDFLRIAVTIGIWFVIFRTPYLIGVYIAKLGLTIDFAVLLLLLLNFAFMIFGSLIGNPILAIIATRIYNTNIEFEV